MEDVDRRIDAIERDLQHGASYLTAEAVRVLSDAARTGPAGAAWGSNLATVAGRLGAAKPAMAGLRNATALLLKRLLSLHPERGRDAAHKLAEKLLADLCESAESAAVNAAEILPMSSTILTCSCSSSVISVAQMSAQRGKSLRPLVFEPGPEAHGRRLARELTALGFPARVVDDLAGRDAIGSAQLCLVGADSITASYLLNGTPSLELARAASGRVPFYVVCQSVKLAWDATVGPGYDHVPLALVTGIVTEDGMLSPEDVGRHLAEAG